MLRLAEEEAARSAPPPSATPTRSASRPPATPRRMRADAAREAEDMRLVQLKELDETRDPHRSPTPSRSAAWPRAEADDLLASAKREADQLRLAAQQEANDLRTTAKREAEQARAAADREVQEARRTLAVEKERLAKEAADHHTSATAETKRLVEEAEERADRRRAAGPRGDRPGHRPSASRPRTRPRRCSPAPAARPSRSSPRPAPRPTRSPPPATPRPSASWPTLKAEVDRLTKRRDAIAAQLASLRDVVAGFGEDDELSKDPAPPRTATADAPRTPSEADATPSRRREPADEDLGEPGRPFSRHSPFYIGFFGGLGALLAFWLGSQLLRDQLGADPDRGRDVPGRRPQPGRRVLRAPRPAAHLRRAGRDRRRSWPR